MDEKDLLNNQYPNYQEEIIGLVKSNISPKLLSDKILGYHESDIAETLPLLEKGERTKIYNALSPLELSNILDYSEDDIELYLSEINIKKRVEVISNLEVDTASKYLDSLDEDEKKKIVSLMDEEAKSEIELFNTFLDDEIGSKLTTNYLEIKRNTTIKGAMKELVSQAAENDNISKLYVTDENVYYGAIDLKDLIIARETNTLEEITMTSYPYVYGHEKISECIERIKGYYEDSIPVLDDDNKLIGVITSSEIVEVVDEEMGEDYAKLAGLTAEEDLEETVLRSTKKRIPWLIILLFLGILVSTVVGMFESIVAEVTIIICFQSLILDMAGNVGTQSLAVTIRVLMDEDLTGKQKAKHIFKEIRVGLLNGIILGVLSFVLVGLYVYLIKHETLKLAFAISSCTGLALIISMVLSSLCGTAIPIILKKLKIDPAVASGPLITTLNDLIAVVSYYGLAWLLLINTLHI